MRMVENMKIVKTSLYQKAAKKIGITEQEEAHLFAELSENPQKGEINNLRRLVDIIREEIK